MELLKGNLMDLSKRSDMRINICPHLQYGVASLADISFCVFMESCRDEYDDAHIQEIVIILYYNHEFIKILNQRMADAKITTGTELASYIDEIKKINYLQNEDPGTFLAHISFWGGRVYKMEPYQVPFKDERNLLENLDAYYQQLVHFIDSHIQDMADGSEELVAFCQK